ncbi:MAG: tape measure protein [Eubacteriales bacterium]
MMVCKKQKSYKTKLWSLLIGLGLLYQTTADAVSKMGIMAADAFNSNEEIIQFTELLNKQFTIAGTSAEGIDAAMLQLTQAMGSGVLRGEEFNAVFEQAPTIMQSYC